MVSAYRGRCICRSAFAALRSASNSRRLFGVSSASTKISPGRPLRRAISMRIYRIAQGVRIKRGLGVRRAPFGLDIAIGA
jgi:hypothetical protein